MTYFKPHHIPQQIYAPASWPVLPALALLLAGVYFVLGLAPALRRSRAAWPRSENSSPPAPPGRHARRESARFYTGTADAARNLSNLRPLIPGSEALSQTQFLERCTRLSAMGRFQIYDFLYYRWEFFRSGALRVRAQAPAGANGPVPAFKSCGLSNAHIWPD